MLLAARWALYRAKRWHYYLLDFCYFANLLLLGHLWVAPRSALLSKVCATVERQQVAEQIMWLLCCISC